MRRADRLDRALLSLALAAPVLYLLLIGARPYPFDAVLKSSLCVLLAILAWRHGKRLLAVALLFSSMGDALLDIDGAKLFVPGLAAFLIAHILYAILFVSGPSLRFARLSAWRLMLLALIPLFAIGYTTLLWPRLSDLALPVACYISVIVAMNVLSLRVPVTIVPIGATLFLISDSLIALDKFLWQADWISPAIWITYVVAQCALTYGLLSFMRNDRIE